ncbi:hybrid sensor histidine kinase/response regulator [Thermodesulfobacterium sp. TA1]|uniref:hybrid sensor histidine kinase/response regulator n=1 Tax=Thermodesulfobacterium sp. TA1 TaxID=2234087 RepID=UPI001231A6FB|nr:chemotaxis protein CheW [Thermodesulfobacterium sp. TA1]QER42070.1 hybrid sensor histidine kinase/response regulator [Thermodesulfobacterium sp. TA1]
MVFDEDILQDFLVEAKEAITNLEEGFLELEKDKENLEVIRSLFRSMHSLKGASGFFGFKSLESIAHFSEDILSKIRDGLLKPEEDIIDMLLKAVDWIKFIVQHLETQKEEPIDDNLLEFLVSLSNFTEKLKKRIEGKEEPMQKASQEPSQETTQEPNAQEPTEEVPQEVEKVEVKEETDKEEEEEKKKEEEPKAVAEKAVAERVVSEKEKKEIPQTATPHVELTETHIKVDVKLLDTLMNLAGELVLARNRVVQLAQKILDDDLTRSVQALSMITTEIQETIMKTRMQPIGMVFNKFPRIVRDLAKSLGKKVNLHLEGTETELDRSIIESIKDPLTHLVRNAIDHGIEPPELRVQMGKREEGTLYLRAYQEGGQVVIEIEDDGRGIDVEKIRKKAVEKGFLTLEEAQRARESDLLQLIFKPGFSTAEKVTQVSGRGVGMDVVKTNIEKLGGTIEINTIYGKGTTVRIKIPLTLAIIPALIVTSHGWRYAIPQVNLKELVSIDPEKDLLKVGDTEFYRLRGEIIPVLKLTEILKQGSRDGVSKDGLSKNLVILTTGERVLGLLVDEILNSEEIVVKPLGKWFKDIPVYSGATIMGDGALALILDVVGLSKYIGLSVEEVEKRHDMKGVTIKTSKEETYFLLLFDVGPDRLALPIALISRLDKVKAEELQIVGGKEVILYEEKVVPVIRLENYLPLQGLPYQDQYTVLFFTERDKTCAILCSAVVDTFETTLEIEEGLYNHPGILGHKIIDGKTVLFIDIYKVIEMYDPEWFIVKIKEEEIHVKRILLAEDSPFFRNMMKNYLSAMGFEVVCVENGREALEKLNIDPHFDLIITDIEMPEMDGFELLKELRANPQFSKLPVIVVTALAGEDIKKKVFELGANGYEVKLQRDQVLERINQLLS